VSRAATVEGDDRLRLFLALELPEDVDRALRGWRERYLTRARPADTLHVTLAFLGSRPRSELEAILGALRESAAETAPFVLEPVRYRETRSVGMLVLDDPSGEATRLATRLHGRLEELRVYRREARPWLPHITVVRFRERPRRGSLRSRERTRSTPPLPEIELFVPSGAAAFLSRLHPSGARYEVIESCSLDARPEDRSVEDVESGG
jgi:2'-5' RNA ligase